MRIHYAQKNCESIHGAQKFSVGLICVFVAMDGRLTKPSRFFLKKFLFKV